MRIKLIVFLIVIVAGGAGWRWFNVIPSANEESKDTIKDSSASPQNDNPLTAIAPQLPILPSIQQQKLATTTIPKEVKAIYVTAHTATNTNRINHLINLVETTPLNSMVINVKDGDNVWLGKDMADLVKRLREKDIYPIARLVIFQDNQLANARPDLVLKNPDGTLWGKPAYRWVDPASQEILDYNANIANKALELGFLEVNFDYIRFPDGQIDDVVYPFYDYSRFKKDVINEAANYLTKKIKEQHPDAIISIDIFAYSLLRDYDIGIGQKFIELADYFDVVAPMIYPSHYADGNFGFDNPAKYPYEVVRQTLLSGKRQLELAGKTAVIRPWIQDFNIGAVYDKEKIESQIKAITDVGYNHGWMAWNPNNYYVQEKYSNPAN